jgi:hypothetical protein
MGLLKSGSHMAQKKHRWVCLLKKWLTDYTEKAQMGLLVKKVAHRLHRKSTDGFFC